MKSKMRFLLAFMIVFATLAFVSCKGNGQGGNGSGNSGGNQTIVKVKITFNPDNLSCKKGEKGDGGDFASGTEIETGQYLKFTAKTETGENLENWNLNGRGRDSATEADFVYQVSEIDANPQKIINVDYKSNFLKIAFDASLMECKKVTSENETNISPNAKVRAGDKYKFIAKTTEDEIADGWYVASVKRVSILGRPFDYTVDVTDADYQNIINVKCDKRAIAKATLNFDSNTTECKKGLLGTGEDINSGTMVKEAEGYKFTAKLQPGQEVKEWYVNGKRGDYFILGKTFAYLVKKEDIDSNNTITIRWEAK